MSSLLPHQRPQTAQLLGHFLPPPLLGAVLDFLDISGLVQVAACNTHWQKEVYNNRPKLWQEIDFLNAAELSGEGFKEKVLNSHACKITEAQLLSLLQRCHAKERCRVLKLTGCLHIRGAGLEPLRGSTMLREIDLRICGSLLRSGEVGLIEPEIDANQVLPILDSMPPIRTNLVTPGNVGLLLVKFDCVAISGYPWDKHNPLFADWLDLHKERLLEEAAKVNHNNPHCGHCSRDIVRVWDSKLELEPDLFDIFPPYSYCEKCRTISCQTGDEPWLCPRISSCDICGVQCCLPRDSARRQGMCPKMFSHCQGVGCYPIRACEDCSLLVCGNCLDWYCGGCAPTAFRQCRNSCRDEEGDLVGYCGGCAPTSFRQCRNSCRDEDGDLVDFCLYCIDDHQQNCAAQQSEVDDGANEN